ncbi:unnamed protein product [Rotaria sp. Silwood1]|nr:unnamed protein product [Rotaria sp. Silwood1]
MVELTKLVLSEMIQGNEGRILMFGSLAAFQPIPVIASYCGTKAFVTNYTHSLINKLRDTKVTDTLLVPEETNTAGASDSKANHMESADDPRHVAQRDYEAMIKGEHRPYGSTKVKLMVDVGQIILNEIITDVTRRLIEKAQLIVDF